MQSLAKGNIKQYGLAFFLTIVLSVQSQPDWRFGFEDTWAHLTGLMTETQKRTLLEKTAWLVESQSGHCDINFPAIQGGWKGMQPSEGGGLDFSQSDRAVQLLQEYGFSMMWNLRINAPWASAGNTSCYGLGDCAPDADHEDDLYFFIYSLVERYDGDGFEDMGFETSSDPSDDLLIPVRFYLMTGEIEFLGPTPIPADSKYGDEATQHFWTDSMESLLRTHRIVYQALHDADPSGKTNLISSGGVLWDLYSDFPDYPEIEGPSVQSRLAGNNNHQVQYVHSFNRLKQILTSFGDDSDGLECDYIGWHPHMPWRELDQTLRFIRTYAGNKPIYIDDMWCNIFPIDQEDAPGNALFSKDAASKEGDFPNTLVSGYTVLKEGLNFNDPDILEWYYARHARTVVKAFVSAFGQGADRVSISGLADLWNDKLNLMSTMAGSFEEKPGYYTYRLMVDKLHDFTQVSEISVSVNPLTRLYLFQCPQGDVYVGWSETGEAPPDLDYSNPNGEIVSFSVDANEVLCTQIILDSNNHAPKADTCQTFQNMLTLRLGYSPVYLEPIFVNGAQSDFKISSSNIIRLTANFPNPFNGETGFIVDLSEAAKIRIDLLNLKGNFICTIADEKYYIAGRHTVLLRSEGLSTGIYIYRLIAERQKIRTGRIILIK